MVITPIQGLSYVDSTLAAEEDGQYALGVLVQDEVGNYYGVYLWLSCDDATARLFTRTLLNFGLEYQVQESAGGVVTEHMKPRGYHGDWMRVAKRVAFGVVPPETLALPAGIGTGDGE